VADEPVAKRQRKYYNPFQAYYKRTRPVSGCSVMKEGASSPDGIDNKIDELESWQSSLEDGDNDVRDPRIGMSRDGDILVFHEWR
jgi:hypothetical protein